MKYPILIFCIFFTIIVESQSLEKIKEQNTFFILLNKNDKLAGYGCTPKNIISSCSYQFLKNNRELFEYSFSYHKYPSLDHKYGNSNQRMLFRIDKSFLRNNKDIIITRVFMEKEGLKAMLNLLYKDRMNKTIFLINTADNKGGKILLREVQMDFTAEE